MLPLVTGQLSAGGNTYTVSSPLVGRTVSSASTSGQIVVSAADLQNLQNAEAALESAAMEAEAAEAAESIPMQVHDL